MYLFHYFKWNRGPTYDSEDTHMKNISPRSHTIKVRVKKKNKQTSESDREYLLFSLIAILFIDFFFYGF